MERGVKERSERWEERGEGTLDDLLPCVSGRERERVGGDDRQREGPLFFNLHSFFLLHPSERVVGIPL